MVPKIACILVLLVLVAVSSYGHKHAFSSQHISRHDGPAHKVYIHNHGHVGHGHGNEHGHKHKKHKKHEKHVNYHAHPKYDFEYKVEDLHTGDKKLQYESRDGDIVKGYYEFHEPGGFIRRVEYHADKHNGFHANVKHTHHIVPKHHHNEYHHH